MRAARPRVVGKNGPAMPAMPGGAPSEAAFEERYALICQAVAEGIYEWDIERNALLPSDRLIEIFGFEGRSLGPPYGEGHGISQVSHPLAGENFLIAAD